jgi:hypothetical protein
MDIKSYTPLFIKYTEQNKSALTALTSARALLLFEISVLEQG